MGKAAKRKSLSLYQRFGLMMVLAGILPIALLSTVLVNWQFREYGDSLRENYVQGLRYASNSLQQLFETYNDISKFSYYYSYTSEGSFTYAYINYDNLRQVLTGENYPEEDREHSIRQGMQVFLRNVLKINSTIQASHFVYYPEEGGQKDYHAGNYNNRFVDLDSFSREMDLSSWNRESRQLMIIPTHSFEYMQGSSQRPKQVFTVARNYYDLKGMVGKEKYVGTLFVDFDINSISEIFRGIDLYSNGELYVCNEQGDCFYSSNPELIGQNLTEAGVDYRQAPKDSLFLRESTKKYGIVIFFKLNGPIIDERMKGIQNLMYSIVILASLILSVASISFSRRITKPIRIMMKRMGDIETGRFEGQLPVVSKDEIGQLSARFNQMSKELQNYTNQVYVSRIKQTEAELNALKSQIYPHFLYNTLEVIRMTAVAEGGYRVAGMLESLGEQIRYLIGTVGDTVTLQDEIANFENYIYLINCRYEGKISFSADVGALAEKKVPKLVLQPIVENAIVHGLKDRDGRIQLDAIEREGKLEITILDDGTGMTEAEVLRLEQALRSATPGEKTEEGWRSIGLKNVHDRLRYLYGEEYGVRLFSTLGVGTAIQVSLPGNIREQEGRHAENDNS